MRRYNENQYGITASPLHGGLPTDRCIAEWWLDSPRVKSVLSGDGIPHGPTAERVAYPADIAGIRARERDGARTIQQANAEQFQDAFARGLAVTGFERTEQRGHLSAGAMAMKLERVTLRQIRMPLVHFFETSFGRTYSARYHSGGSPGRRRFRLGRSHRRREPLL